LASNALATAGETSYHSRVQRLQQRVLVIIGGTSGLGLSAAQAFIREGAHVVIGRDGEKVSAAEKQLGLRAFGVVGDAAEPTTAHAAIQTAVTKFGGFHGLYHVAGGSGRKHGDGPLHELSDAGWDYTLRENLTSLFYSNRAAAQQFLQQGTAGAVLNMGSVLGFSPSPQFFTTHAYAAAKAAIIGLTQSAAAAYASAGIRFNVIAPALVATPMSQRAQGDDAILNFIRTKQPLDGGRISQPADLDGAAVFLLSDEAKLITGQVLAVDGGWCMSEGQLSGVTEKPSAAGNVLNTVSRWLGKLTGGK
jgi:NAD(P)-dependent dehydrogenase (short-subunit alcohol dehydrogenase family)